MIMVMRRGCAACMSAALLPPDIYLSAPNMPSIMVVNKGDDQRGQQSHAAVFFMSGTSSHSHFFYQCGTVSHSDTAQCAFMLLWQTQKESNTQTMLSVYKHPDMDKVNGRGQRPLTDSGNDKAKVNH